MASSSVPPLRPPGTHTNEEVKEALHARARLRTYCISALVVLLLAALAVVYYTAQDYENEAELTSKPKMVVLVAGDLSYPALAVAQESEKVPFIHQLAATGGSFGKLDAAYRVGGSALVKLLTGDATSTSMTLEGETSVLRRLKNAGFKPAVVAPAAYWSAISGNAEGSCARVGMFDTECVGDSCPGHNEQAYCNTEFKYTTCDGEGQIFSGDIVRGFVEAAESGADIIYIQVEVIRNNIYTPSDRPVSNMLERFSQMNLLDNCIGEIALALSRRTSISNENWLMALTSEGQNRHYEAPLFISAYSRGMIAKLNPVPSDAKTVDLYSTILHWFGEEESNGRSIGICSSGIKIKNCA